jgi:hypothetical protein
MSELDLENLANELGIEEVTEKFKIDVDKHLNRTDINDPDTILTENLAKANAILDRVIEEMNAGNFSARMVEVSAMIMSTVAGLTSQIYRKISEEKTLQLRQNMLELKAKQIKISDGVKNQNIIVTDRETVLKFLREGQQQKLIENKEDN